MILRHTDLIDNNNRYYIHTYTYHVLNYSQMVKIIRRLECLGDKMVLCRSSGNPQLPIFVFTYIHVHHDIGNCRSCSFEAIIFKSDTVSVAC